MIRRLVVAAIATLVVAAVGGPNPSEGEFEQQTLAFFDATTVHPGAKGFQLADYDSTGRRAIFYPWGGIATNPSGVVLAYHTDEDFFSASSYDAVDLTTLVSPDATGFGTGFLDPSATWSYFVPFRKNYNGTIYQTANDLAVRFDLTKELADPSAYETFHVNSMPSPPPQTGWISGAYADGYAYYVPFATPLPTDPLYLPHGILLRYDTSMSFADPAAWEWYDLEAQIDPRAVGLQSVAFKAPWLYLVPYYPGNNLLVRYDVTKPFTDSASYETIDLTSLNPNAIGYTGAIMAGDVMVLVPWRKRIDLVDLPNQSASMAAAFDTGEALSDPAAWSFLDLTSVHPQARGYQFGWSDNQGFVHLVPTHNFATGLPPPFVVWDSSLPFTAASSWASYANVGYPATGSPSSTGAAYDGLYAWMAPYGSTLTGGVGNSGLITRVDSGADGDTDGVTNAEDNCPAWPNPSQVLPAWSVPAADADCDGFPDAVTAAGRGREDFMQTDAGDACPDNAADNAWPPDVNNSGATNLTDVVLFGATFNKSFGQPGYNARMDLTAGPGPGAVNLSDIVVMGAFFNKSCAP